jgi:sulfate adenylyltransferase subunit 1
LYFIPIAAKEGDNVVNFSIHMSWYKGLTLLQCLESLPVHKKDNELPARFPVQFVIRPHSDVHHDFRGYAGKIESGCLKVGDEVVVLPSLKSSRITRIIHGFDEKDIATSGQSITVELETDVDVSRGNMLVRQDDNYNQVSAFTATLSWMGEEALTAGKTYLLQHGVNIIKAKITILQSRLDIESMEAQGGITQFRLNDIGKVTIKTAKPIFADRYSDNPANGAFILVDEFLVSLKLFNFYSTVSR